MNRNQYIIFTILAVILLLIFFLFQNLAPAERDWDENYEPTNKEPYGTFIIKKLLEDQAGEEHFHIVDTILHASLPITNSTQTNYIFIGNSIFLDSASVDSLRSFVFNGNNVFISSKTIPTQVMQGIYPYSPCTFDDWEDFNSYYFDIAYLSLDHPELKRSEKYPLTYLEEFERSYYEWSYIDSIFICDSLGGLISIGSFNTHFSNFAKFPFGDGAFYLHTTPLAFSNMALLKEDGLEYAEKVLAHLPEGDIYWDENHQIEDFISKALNNSSNSGNGLPDNNPLQFILSQRELSWAWYLTLALALLYVLFRAKRKQKVIPVVQPNKNTSLEFLQSVGTLYFMQNNHRNLILQKMRLFLGFIRQKYSLHISETPEAGTLEKLHQHSEVSLESIQRIFLLFKNTQSSDFVSEKALVSFHQAVEAFYKNAK